MRLALFWSVMYCADIFSAFIAIPIFKLGGVQGREGWRVRASCTAYAAAR